MLVGDLYFFIDSIGNYFFKWDRSQNIRIEKLDFATHFPLVTPLACVTYCVNNVS